MSRPVHLKDGLNYTGSGGGSSNHLTDKMVANYEDSSISTHHYDIGEQFIYTTKLYEATSAISIGDTIVTDGANANCMESDSLTEQIAKKGSADNFIGTRQQWEALTPEEQSKYRTMDLIGDHEVITLTATLSFTTNNSAFYGQTITVKDGNDTTLTTATFSNQGTATATLIGSAGYYIASVTAYGVTVTEQIVLTESTTYNMALNSDTILGAWIDKGGLDYTDYADFSEVEADEEAVRRLMTIHASVDYLAECQSASDTLASSIINSDICAKWINLRDYALDTLYANDYIKTMMNTSDKYFYGEWVITGNTTTPPTWGAKGNVPIMTANDAPYRKIIYSSEYTSNGRAAWEAFDGIDGIRDDGWLPNSNESSNYIGYKFTNPVCVKELYISQHDYDSNSFSCQLKASNDGSTWDNIGSSFTLTQGNRQKNITVNNTSYYLYYRVDINGVLYSANNYDYDILSLQFYGRELRESVPVMTSNTAPYGVASASGNTSGNDAYTAFDGNDSTFIGGTSSNSFNVGYQFPQAVKITSFYVNNVDLTSFKIQYYDGSAWVDATDSIASSTGVVFGEINGSILSDKWRLLAISTSGACHINTLQFYGLNYTEYDWDADHPRHYLYDHGVELESLEPYTYAGTATATRKADQLYQISNNGQHSLAQWQTVNPIDLTDYKKIFVVVGNKLSCSSNIHEYIRLGVCSAKPTTYIIEDVAYQMGLVNMIALCKTISLDVSAINQSLYVRIGDGTYSSYGYMEGSEIEWWLE